MSDLKSFLGRRSETWKFKVTEQRLKAFCDSVGATYRGEAPLTFLTVFRDGEFKLLADMGLKLSQVLHADQEFQYYGKVLPGDELEYDAIMSKALEKQGSSGPMRFLVFETDIKVAREQKQVLVGMMKTTVIVRGNP